MNKTVFFIGGPMDGVRRNFSLGCPQVLTVDVPTLLKTTPTLTDDDISDFEARTSFRVEQVDYRRLSMHPVDPGDVEIYILSEQDAFNSIVEKYPAAPSEQPPIVVSISQGHESVRFVQELEKSIGWPLRQYGFEQIGKSVYPGKVEIKFGGRG